MTVSASPFLFYTWTCHEQAKPIDPQPQNTNAGFDQQKRQGSRNADTMLPSYSDTHHTLVQPIKGSFARLRVEEVTIASSSLRRTSHLSFRPERSGHAHRHRPVRNRPVRNHLFHRHGHRNPSLALWHCRDEPRTDRHFGHQNSGVLLLFGRDRAGGLCLNCQCSRPR